MKKRMMVTFVYNTRIILLNVNILYSFKVNNNNQHEFSQYKTKNTQ